MESLTSPRAERPIMKNNILLIEDDHSQAFLTRMAIDDSKQACQVHHINNGGEAIEFLRRESQNHRSAVLPNLILLDLNMPGLPGCDVLIKIKEDKNLKVIPVVIVSPSEDEDDVKFSYGRGASGYIYKSMSVDKFFSDIKACILYWFGAVALSRNSA